MPPFHGVWKPNNDQNWNDARRENDDFLFHQNIIYEVHATN